MLLGRIGVLACRGLFVLGIICWEGRGRQGKRDRASPAWFAACMKKMGRGVCQISSNWAGRAARCGVAAGVHTESQGMYNTISM